MATWTSGEPVSPSLVAYSSMIFFFVAASIDTDVLLSVSRCAAPPCPNQDLSHCVNGKLLKIRGRSNGAPNLPAVGSCQRIPGLHGGAEVTPIEVESGVDSLTIPSRT